MSGQEKVACPVALTTAQIQSAIPRERTYRLRDSQCLYLEVSPRGGKWWRFRYGFEGRDNFISLGVFPIVGLKEARTKRDEAKRLLLQGIDPSKKRQLERIEKQQARARDLADNKAGGSHPNIKIIIFTDDKVEIWKGKNVLRLAQDEARHVSHILTRLLQEEEPHAAD